MDPEFSRNLGFYSEEEQAQINNSTVAIAGAGGDGGMLAIQLARLGVGELRLADPDPFERENINRQAACTQKTIGINKAVVVADYIHDINPSIETKVYANGVQSDNVEKFLKGTDLLIDETEFTMHSIGVMLARTARKYEVPNLMAMNIGFGTTVTSFMPKGKSFERTLGLSENMSLEQIDKQDVALSRWLAYIPSYADLDVFKKVASGEKSAPSVAPGVAIAAGVAATQAVLHLTRVVGNNRPKPVEAPRVLMIDAMTAEARRIRYPLLSHYKYLAKMLIKNSLGKVPKASY